MFSVLATVALSTLPQPLAQQSCAVAIAGAGPGGIYFAWRLLTLGFKDTVCILERSSRFGGRIYSLREQGPKADLTVDMGAYRYAPKPYQEGDWYIYTPLLGGLIDNKLGLPSAPYEPGNLKSTVRKLVDDKGQNAGYATFVEAMMRQLQTYPNVKIEFHQELISLALTDHSSSSDGSSDGSGVSLTFASGLVVTAGKAVLNMPQLPLLKVLDRSKGLAMPPVLQAPAPMDGVKLYVHCTRRRHRPSAFEGLPTTASHNCIPQPHP